MPKFSMGDVVIGQNFVHSTKRNGMEARIVRGYGLCSVFRVSTNTDTSIMGYVVEWEDGDITAQKEYQLRKKHPPSKDIEESRNAELPSFDELMKKAKSGELAKEMDNA